MANQTPRPVPPSEHSRTEPEGPYTCRLCDKYYVVPALARHCETKHEANPTVQE